MHFSQTASVKQDANKHKGNSAKGNSAKDKTTSGTKYRGKHNQPTFHFKSEVCCCCQKRGHIA